VTRYRIVVLVALLVGCASGPSEPGPNDGASLNFDTKATIVVDDAAVTPSVTKAKVGDAISVTNRGTKDHGLTSDKIETGTLRPGESTTVFLTEAGTVELHDRATPSHTARIEVAAGS
jgi:plastocyanin